MVTRVPSVAGMFYPKDADALSQEIEAHLNEVPKYSGPAAVGVIAPHAGYIYSGSVAAQATDASEVVPLPM